MPLLGIDVYANCFCRTGNDGGEWHEGTLSASSSVKISQQMHHGMSHSMVDMNRSRNQSMPGMDMPMSMPLEPWEQNTASSVENTITLGLSPLL